MHTYTLTKSLEGFWLLLIRRADGSTQNYRFATKSEAQRWLRQAGLTEGRSAR